MAFDAEGFRSAVSKKFPGMSANQKKQLDEYISRKQAQDIAAAGVPVKDIPSDANLQAILAQQIANGTYNQGAKDQKQGVLELVDLISNRNLGPVTGRLQVGNLLRTPDTTYTNNLLDQLTGQLSLENRNQLKGSGQISDYESKLLQDAVSALSGGLSETDFRSELGRIRGTLGKESGKKPGTIGRFEIVSE